MGMARTCLLSGQPQIRHDHKGSVALLLPFGNRIGQRHEPLSLGEMQTLDHDTVNFEHALVVIRGIGKRLDRRPRILKRAARRSENPVGGIKLVGMDHRLSVETEFPSLLAFRG